MGKRIMKKIALFGLGSLILVACPPKKICEVPSNDTVKPQAKIQVIYKKENNEETWNVFSFQGNDTATHTSNVLQGKTFTIWNMAEDMGCLNQVKVRWVVTHNNATIENQNWIVFNYASEPVTKFFKGYNFDNPHLNYIYTFYIYSKDCHNNITQGNITVKVKNTLSCLENGGLLKSLTWNGDTIAMHWNGTLNNEEFNAYCENRRIKKITLSRLVYPNGTVTGGIIMQSWNVNLGGYHFTDFTCNSSTNECTKDVDIPLTNYEIEIWSPNHIFEIEQNFGFEISSYNSESVKLTIQ